MATPISMISESICSARVLIVEDNPGEVELLRTHLNCNDFHSFSLRIWEAGDLATALSTLDHLPIDVVLLDLNLPDSQSLDTLLRLRERHPETAVVVMTGMEDEVLGLEAIRHNAQDYLLKGRMDGPLLVRSLRYAVERQRLKNELEYLRFKQRQRQEVSQLESYSDELAQEGGRVFSLATNYGALVRQYVFATRERNSRPTAMVQNLAERLAAMGASAREVVRLHVKVLKDAGNWTSAAEERAFSIDARLALLELLGSLADCYRNASSMNKGV